MVQRLGLCTSTAGGDGSVSCLGNYDPTWQQKKKSNKKTSRMSVGIQYVEPKTELFTGKRW